MSGARGRLGRGRLLSSLAWGVLVIASLAVGEWESGRVGGACQASRGVIRHNVGVTRHEWRTWKALTAFYPCMTWAQGAGAPVAGAEVFPDLCCHSSQFDSFVCCQSLFVVKVDKCR